MALVDFGLETLNLTKLTNKLFQASFNGRNIFAKIQALQKLLLASDPLNAVVQEFKIRIRSYELLFSFGLSQGFGSAFVENLDHAIEINLEIFELLGQMIDQILECADLVIIVVGQVLENIVHFFDTVVFDIQIPLNVINVIIMLQWVLFHDTLHLNLDAMFELVQLCITAGNIVHEILGNTFELLKMSDVLINCVITFLMCGDHFVPQTLDISN